MKNYKKFLITLCCTALIFTLCACSNNNQNSNSTNNAEINSETNLEETNKEELNISTKFSQVVTTLTVPADIHTYVGGDGSFLAVDFYDATLINNNGNIAYIKSIHKILGLPDYILEEMLHIGNFTEQVGNIVITCKNGDGIYRDFLPYIIYKNVT